MIAANKAKERFATSGNTAVTAITSIAAPDYIFVKSDYKTLKINLSDIFYLEGLGDYVCIHLADKKILTLEKMKHLERVLPSPQFVPVHRSYLVAVQKIDFIERNRIVIKEKRLPIGATYKDAFWEVIEQKK